MAGNSLQDGAGGAVAPALRFNAIPYHINDANNMLLRFQELGYVVLRGVFERESVDAYREQVAATIVRSETGRLLMPADSPLSIWPTRAPRIRQMLPGALWPAAMKPQPSMFEASWLISEPGPPVSADKGWHKDRDHEGMPGSEYHYPHDIHVGMYLEDMTPERGPTQVIPRSHRDRSLSPFSGAEPHSWLIRKEDAVLWDQRAWHRGTTRTLGTTERAEAAREETGTAGGGPPWVAAHLRIFAIFGFYGVPVYGPDRRAMPEAQRQAWLAATDPYEQVLYGGTFTPDSVLGGGSPYDGSGG